MDIAILQQEIFIWVLGLVIGLPLLVVLLGEVSERLAQQENPLAQTVRQIRHYVIPLVAALLIMRPIVGLASSEPSVQVVETLLWLTVIYAGLTLISNLAQIANLNPGTLLATIPKIFFALGRGLVIGLAGFYLISYVWQVDLSNMATALGVGSLVIALALQETFSNLVSGFLLIADNPFKVGDMIQVGDELLIVQDVTWRTTRCISDRDGSLVMIPNGLLGNETFRNHGSRELSRLKMRHSVSFSYNDPPNRVSRIMLETLKQIDFVLDTPAPRVFLVAYEDSAIRYELRYYVSVWHRSRCIDMVNRHIYYVAKRHDLTFQYPTQVSYEQGTVDLPPLKVEHHLNDIQKSLRALYIFAILEQATIDYIVQAASVGYYGAGESIVREGEPDAGFYIIQSGQVTLSVRDKKGQTQQIGELMPGDFFGEMALLRGEPSPISVIATADLEVLIIEHQTMADLIMENPQFALEMDTFIEERKKMIASVLDAEDRPSRANGRVSVKLT